MESYQKKQMKQKDQRVNLVNEVLNGIKVLKLYAWETSFMEKLLEIRKIEVDYLKKYQYLEASQFMIFNSAPFIVSLASFASYVLLDPISNVLDAKTAFVSLTLFRTLREPLFMLPFGINNIIQGGVSLKRINQFLNAPEVDLQTISHDDTWDDPIVVRHASFTWGSSKSRREEIRNLNFTIKPGSLVAVVGHVGAGKSSLLSALLGEMIKTKGQANVNGSVAYVSQQAWIRHMSFRKNILCGYPFSRKLYDKVVDGCALREDIAMLNDGEETEIGEKGINLSGGQKQRVNMARAVYANRDIYLLDDPLSAVDSHVGKHIFNKVIGPRGILREKTRILVTHGISFLPVADLILVMEQGNITEMGSYRELLERKGAFSNFIAEQLRQDDKLHLQEDLETDLSETLKHQSGGIPKKRIKTMSLGSLSEASFDMKSSILETSSTGTEYKSFPGKRIKVALTSCTVFLSTSIIGQPILPVRGHAFKPLRL
jgi:ATP-binding cassette subfamily C (CFTR/MRP) protein 1